MKESFDDIWKSMPRVIEEDGILYWLTVNGNIGGVSVCYESGDGKMHDIERNVFLMSVPANSGDDEPTKALYLLRNNYKAWLSK